jgi:hypothetical protein
VSSNETSRVENQRVIDFIHNLLFMFILVDSDSAVEFSSDRYNNVWMGRKCDKTAGGERRVAGC